MVSAGVKRSHDKLRDDRVKRKHKKAKTQKEYHSSSEDEGFQLPQLRNGKHPKPQEAHTSKTTLTANTDDSIVGESELLKEKESNGEETSDIVTGESSESSYGSDGDAEMDADDDDAGPNAASTRRKATSARIPKRNDPNAFATSMAKILDSKLSTSKRADPVLARSQTALAASKEISESKLEAKARQKIRAEKKEVLEKGRVRDVLGLSEKSPVTAEAVAQEEKRLKKIAQRGVIKLFNAVRAAQVKGEEATREAKKAGIVGMKQREGRVNEMSKKGFLDLIAAGGKTTSQVTKDSR